jgi:hypothetical protein
MPTHLSRWSTFRLRTLFILVAAIGLVAAQWPFFVEKETKTTAGLPGTTSQTILIETRYQLSNRFLLTLAVEAIAIVAWFGVKGVRNHHEQVS